MPRFLYFYFMKNAPEKIGEVVPAHVSYWHDLKLPSYMGGPFADRSGGAISFEADNLDKAAALIENDPFVKADLLEQRWVKEWKIE